ncbi:MAG: hypothetical protein PHV59_02065 [Victivallales bacterium]|nr:hypothetical protein [Victivallales bacterium]
MAAGLLAATMSSVDSGVNACTLAWTKDFYHRFYNRNEISHSMHMRYSVYFSLLFGGMIIALAEYFIVIFGRHQNIFEMVNRIINAFGSPLLAVVVLGMIKKRRPGANSVFWGGLCGAVFSAVTGLMLDRLALHYYAVLNLLATFGFCYLFELAGYAVKQLRKH